MHVIFFHVHEYSQTIQIIRKKKKFYNKKMFQYFPSYHVTFFYCPLTVDSIQNKYFSGSETSMFGSNFFYFHPLSIWMGSFQMMLNTKEKGVWCCVILQTLQSGFLKNTFSYERHLWMSPSQLGCLFIFVQNKK